MKLIQAVTIIYLVMCLVACKDSKSDAAKGEYKMEMNKSGHGLEKDESISYYTCPMESHKQIHNNNPGKCSECGMELVAAVVTNGNNTEYYGCPMPIHSHIRQSEPGTCEECGMKLLPMRLVKS